MFTAPRVSSGGQGARAGIGRRCRVLKCVRALNEIQCSEYIRVHIFELHGNPYLILMTQRLKYLIDEDKVRVRGQAEQFFRIEAEEQEFIALLLWRAHEPGIQDCPGPGGDGRRAYRPDCAIDRYAGDSVARASRCFAFDGEKCFGHPGDGRDGSGLTGVPE